MAKKYVIKIGTKNNLPMIGLCLAELNSNFGLIESKNATDLTNDRPMWVQLCSEFFGSPGTFKVQF